MAGNSGNVDERTRTFAIYGLGQIGYRTTNNDVRKEIVGTLIELLKGDALNSSQRDMSVAALTSFGLTPIDSNPEWAPAEGEEAVGNETREAQVKWLMDYYDDKLGVNFLVRAHVPTAMARLVQFADPRTQFKNAADQDYRELKTTIAKRLLADIDKNAKGVEREIAQSAIVALGQIGDADEDEIDAEIRQALIDVPEALADQQARHFGLIALAQSGGRPGKGEGDPLAGTGDVRKGAPAPADEGQSRPSSHGPAWLSASWSARSSIRVSRRSMPTSRRRSGPSSTRPRPRVRSALGRSRAAS